MSHFICLQSILYWDFSITYTGGWNHLFWRIIFSIHGHGKWYLKNCISFLWSVEIIVYNFMENIYVQTKFNVLFNNKHLILLWSFLLIDNEFEDITSSKSVSIIMKISKIFFFPKLFSISIISFSVSIENHPSYLN